MAKFPAPAADTAAATAKVTFKQDGTSSLTPYDPNGRQGNGKVTLYYKGTWGSGTITFSIKPTTENGDTDQWFALTTTVTANGYLVVEGKFDAIEAVLSGSTNPSLTVWMMS